MNFGQIRNLNIRSGELVFDPRPVVLIDSKLDGQDTPRPEIETTDFVLPAEICRLMAHLDHIGDGVIEHIEVRAGIPRRVLFESAMEPILRVEIKA
jgi:hypothetical protein